MFFCCCCFWSNPSPIPIDYFTIQKLYHSYLSIVHTHSYKARVFVAFYAYMCCWWSEYEWFSHVFKLRLWINEIVYLFKCKFKRQQTSNLTYVCVWVCVFFFTTVFMKTKRTANISITLFCWVLDNIFKHN